MPAAGMERARAWNAQKLLQTPDHTEARKGRLPVAVGAQPTITGTPWSKAQGADSHAPALRIGPAVATPSPCRFLPPPAESG